MVKLWRALTRFVMAEPLAAWPYGEVRFVCARCGRSDTRTVDDCITAYGPNRDIRDILAGRKNACGRADCELVVDGLEIPRHYR